MITNWIEHRLNRIVLFIYLTFNPETTTGGNALKFYSSVRLDIRRIGAWKEGDETVGNDTRVKVVKNKMAPPFRQAEFKIRYGKGIDKVSELIDLGVKHKLVHKAGAWYDYKGNRFQGNRNMRAELLKNPDLSNEIESEIKAIMFGEPAVDEQA